MRLDFTVIFKSGGWHACKSSSFSGISLVCRITDCYHTHPCFHLTVKMRLTWIWFICWAFKFIHGMLPYFIIPFWNHVHLLHIVKRIIMISFEHNTIIWRLCYKKSTFRLSDFLFMFFFSFIFVVELHWQCSFFLHE